MDPKSLSMDPIGIDMDSIGHSMEPIVLSVLSNTQTGEQDKSKVTKAHLWPTPAEAHAASSAITRKVRRINKT
jgi:hypothetical protein